MRAVILAGGRGTRLAPYTSILPKPLMPIGDRAILELVLERLFVAGIDHVTLCVGYLSHLIRAVLENGGSDRPRPSLTYIQEQEPLGTAGPLRFVDDLEETFLVMNGDVLTRLDFTELVRSHLTSKNVLTVAAHRRVIQVDYGVLGVSRSGSPRVDAIYEKPQIPVLVSAGIYVMEPEVLGYIPDGYFDFPDLVQRLLDSHRPVGVYEFDGFWLDLGRPEDYAHAVESWEQDPHLIEPRVSDESSSGGLTMELTRRLPLSSSQPVVGQSH